MLTVAALLLAVGAYGEVEIDGIHYLLDKDAQTASVGYRVLVVGLYSGDVSIPESVTYEGVRYTVTGIKNYVFAYCEGLRSVTIPSTVKSIGTEVFEGSRNLAAINVSPDNTAYCSEDGVLYDKGKTTLCACPGGKSGDFIIPSTVTSIADFAFVMCNKLTSISIQEGVASIGRGALCDCGGLTAIEVSSDNTVYCSEDGVLYDKSKTTLCAYPGGKGTEFSVPVFVTSIGDFAFSADGILSTVFIPATVTTIGDRAFYNSRVTTVYSSTPVPPAAGRESFLGLPQEAVLYVPAGTVEAYRAASGWSHFQNIQEFDPTCISGVEADKGGKDIYYDLGGRRLKAPVKGLNIVGGRKVMVK